MSKVKVTWKAFGDKPQINRFVSSVEFELPTVVEAKKICEQIYEETNHYSGEIWDIIQPLLFQTRTHTSISVGDEIEIDGQVWVCADFGFEKIEDVEIQKIGETIFSVSGIN
jgi:hypothetical protein